MNTRFSTISVTAVSCILCAVGWASHVNRVEEHALDDGGLRRSESWNRDWFIYRSIGGESVVKGAERKRKWWCAWLCKRRVDREADLIVVRNTYYSELSPGVFASAEKSPRQCSNASSCRQREWAVGGGVEFPFPGGGGIEDLLPIDGVITRHEITIDGRRFVELTAAGRHPQPDGPIIE